MIPIKEAIISGLWINCDYYDTLQKKSFQFRFKILKFEKLDLVDVDSPEEIHFKDEGTIIWIMDLEVINFTKESIDTEKLDNLILVDQDGFKFYSYKDDHLRYYSEFAKEKKLDRFYIDQLIPKIKAVGAISFQLPDDDDAFYCISVKNGNIVEV